MDLVAAIVEAVQESPQDDTAAMVKAVLSALTKPALRNDLHEAIHAALLSARAAYLAREDLYDNPSNSRVAAEIATAAIANLLTGSIAAHPTVTLDEAQRIAAMASYRDWRFRAVPMAGGGVGIEVEATNPDSHHPDRTFTTTRVAEVTSTTEEACFRAALLVEYHEAQERFRVDGRAVFDSHSADNVPAPSNFRAPPP